MKKLLFTLLLIPYLTWAFPVYTNRLDFNPAESTGQFDDFLWRWSGFDDQAFELLFRDVTVSNVGFRLAYPQRGKVFLDVLPPATTNALTVVTNEVLDIYTNFYPAVYNRVTDRGATNITVTLNYSNGIFLSRSIVTNSSRVGSVQNTDLLLAATNVVYTQSAAIANTEAYGQFTNSYVVSENTTITVSNFLEKTLVGTFKQGNSTFYFFDPIKLSGFDGLTIGGGLLTNGFTITRQATLITNFSFVAGETYLIADETYLQQGQFVYELSTTIGADTNKQIIYSSSSSSMAAQNIKATTNLFTPLLSGAASVYRTAISTANTNSIILYSSGITIYEADATNLSQSISTNIATLPATNVVEFAFPSTQRVSKIYSKTETAYSKTTFNIPRTNIPPDGPYFAEVLTYSGASPTNATQSRTLAKGQVTIENSIWSVTNYAGYTNYPGPWDYLLQDGSRPMAGNLNMGGSGVTNASVFAFTNGATITASNVNLWNSFIAGTGVSLTAGTVFDGDVTGVWNNLTLEKDALVDMDFIKFDTNFTSAAEGRLVATTTGSLQFGLRGGTHNLDIGHELLAYVRNGETNTLNPGTAVYFDGNQGDVPLVLRASATNEAHCQNLAGIVTESIAVNGFGRVTWFGQVRSLDIDPFQTYTNATILYLSTIAGQFTNVPPTPPNHRVVLGRVERNQSSGGGDIIHVQIDIGEHLEYLHDVNVNAATTNDLLIYNGTVWTNYARTNLSGIYLPLAGGTMSGDLNMGDGSINEVFYFRINGQERVNVEGREFYGSWTFDTQPTIPGYVNTNNLSTIAGSGLGVTSNRLVVTNTAGTFEALTGNRFVLGNGQFPDVSSTGAFVAVALRGGSNSIGSVSYGASQHGDVLGTATIQSGGVGASQHGRIIGVANIESAAFGAMQRGEVESNATIFINTGSMGSQQQGRFLGTNRIESGVNGAMQIGMFSEAATIRAQSHGAVQRGNFSGTATIFQNSPGASQFGFLDASSQADNSAAGAIQLLGGSTSTFFITSSTAEGSILLGPGTQTNAYGILANGPIETRTRFVGNAAGLTNFPYEIYTNTPAIFIGTNHGAMITSTVFSNTALHIPPTKDALGAYNRSQRIAFHSFAADGVTVTSATLFVNSGTNLQFSVGLTPSANVGNTIWHNGNFNPSSYLTISAGNTNYWRITTAPTGATSSGSSGQMAVDGTNLFIYSPNALGTGTARWLRVSGSASW